MMRIRDRRVKWGLALAGVALLPVAMTLAVLASFEGAKAVPVAPRVVATWAAGPMETRVAFNLPVDPSVATQAVGHLIRFGSAASSTPGVGRPGGDGGALRVAAARLVDEDRTLILITDPHPAETTYMLTLDAIKPPGETTAGRSQVVTYTLKGVEVAWTADGKTEPTWSGWWPDVDPAVVRVDLAGSSTHNRLWPLLKQAGKLTLRTFVGLPPARVEMDVTGSTPFEVTFGGESAQADPKFHARFASQTTAEPVELTSSITTLAGGPEPTLHWTVAAVDSKDDTPMTLPVAALGVAWAPPPLPNPAPAVIPPALGSGGDPSRGAIVFVSEAAKCAHCHQIRGVGGQVGPDLSSLAAADRAWVYQNIMEPSAAIHPDYVSYTLTLKDGRISMGIVRADGADALRVGDIDAKYTTFSRAEVEEIRPSSSSIMPVGLLGALGEEQTRDLLAFLTSQQPAVSPAPAAGP